MQKIRNGAVRGWFEGQQPKASKSAALEALWWAGHGEWEKSHNLAQEDVSPEGCWVHAHLHRVEGDLANAGYWYRRAGRPIPITGLLVDEEWEQMVEELLGRDGLETA